MRLLVALMISLLALGCAGHYLDGKIQRVADGKIYPMKIQTSYGQGKMEAVNPETGETFTGTYTAVGNRASTARAFLVGDKGTTLQIVMEIQAGLRPIGTGEAADNKGNRYHVEF